MRRFRKASFPRVGVMHSVNLDFRYENERITCYNGDKPRIGIASLDAVAEQYQDGTGRIIAASPYLLSTVTHLLKNYGSIRLNREPFGCAVQNAKAGLSEICRSPYEPMFQPSQIQVNRVPGFWYRNGFFVQSDADEGKPMAVARVFEHPYCADFMPYAQMISVAPEMIEIAQWTIYAMRDPFASRYDTRSLNEIWSRIDEVIRKLKRQRSG